MSKLTEDDVRAIRRDTRRLHEVAKDFGVSLTLVRRIRTFRAWAHVPEEKPPVVYPNHRRKLTPEIVRAIRADPRRPETIAIEHGVSVSTVAKVKRRRDYIGT
jgi:hypothetical protein